MILALSTRIRILLNPYTFLSGCAFHPHASGESNLRIRERLNLFSRVETFESDIFSDTCGRSNLETFESDDVAWLGPVSTVILTAWLQNNMAAWPKCFSVFVGLRVLGKTNLYSRLSLKFYILYTLLVGVRPHHWLQAIKRNICTWRRQKNLKLFDTNTNLPPKTHLIRYCTCSIEQYLERSPGYYSESGYVWTGGFNSYPDTCGRKNF